MAPAKGEECARAGCSCRTTSGKYCSAQCEAPEETPERLLVRTRHLHAQQLGIKPYVKNQKFSSPTTLALICDCDLSRMT